eukprot:scaffold13097_cov183-Skeletonema_dohrnii-CCMP3373.AAC.1
MFKKSEEGSWKCGVCMVTNKPSDSVCPACETPKPGSEVKAAGVTSSASAPAAGSIGAGGFSFGAPAATSSSSIGAGGFSFGGSAPAPAPATSGVTGFNFAAAPKKEDSTATAPAPGGFSFGIGSSTTSAAPSGFNFAAAAAATASTKPTSDVVVDKIEELSTAPGKKAAQAFDIVLADADGCTTTLPSSQFEALVDEVGEGFHGDEMDKQLAAINKDDQGDISRNAFVRWYCSLVDQDDDDDGSSQESEIAEEKEKAEEAFDALANDSEHISVTEFPKLLESLGSTYCEEEHRRTIKKISSVDDASSDKVITRKAFIDWYIEWLFGDGDSEEESDDESTAGADGADSSDAAAKEST